MHTVAVGLAVTALSLSLSTRLDGDEPISFPARSRVTVDGRDVVKTTAARWAAKETAVVICDMWARHWCDGASRRVAPSTTLRCSTRLHTRPPQWTARRS